MKPLNLWRVKVWDSAYGEGSTFLVRGASSAEWAERRVRGWIIEHWAPSSPEDRFYFDTQKYSLEDVTLL